MSFLRKAIMLLNREIPTETLIKRGMRVGKDFNRQQGCFLDPSHCFLITIGDDVFIGPKVQLITTNHGTAPSQRRVTVSRPIVIGRHVWLGAGVIVLPEVTIGENSIIGAGSVVNHDIPANVIAAGSPAKVIKPVPEE